MLSKKQMQKNMELHVLIWKQRVNCGKKEGRQLNLEELQKELQLLKPVKPPKEKQVQGDVDMQKKISDITIDLIKEHISEIEITIPLKSEEDVQAIADYFEKMEVSMANALSDGEQIDRSKLDAVAHAFDELADFEDDDFHDLEDLNRRLISA